MRGRPGGKQKKIEDTILNVLTLTNEQYSVDSFHDKYQQFTNQQIYIAFKTLFADKKLRCIKNGRTKLYFNADLSISNSFDIDQQTEQKNKPKFQPIIPKKDETVINLKPKYLNSNPFPIKSTNKNIRFIALNDKAKQFISQFGNSVHISAIEGKDMLASVGKHGEWLTTDSAKQDQMPYISI